jgi:hypothetical protein
MGLGILINYCLMLTGQPVARVFLAGLIVAILGGLRLLEEVRVQPARAILEFRAAALSICCVTYLLGVYSLQLLSEPLIHGDGRSIWFFHARMIWLNGALGERAGWTHSSIAFSHPDDPMLVPAIAAQLASLMGYWNEFVPKGSLIVMLTPLVLWVFSFHKWTLSFVLLVLTFFFSLGGWLWNGYMDGYLAMYGGVALLSFGRYLSGTREVDLCSAIVAAGIAASLKNEGVLFAVCFATAVLVLGVKYSECSLMRLAPRLRSGHMAATVLLSISPTIIWAICKRAWGLQNDLTGDPVQGWARLSTRLFDGRSSQYLVNHLFVWSTAIWLVLALLAALLMFQRLRRLKPHPGAVVGALTATLYAYGLCAVYLSTPYGLEWHLGTSATRTMMTASMALCVSIFFLLSDLEREPRHSL